jgi:hypothetical protein
MKLSEALVASSQRGLNAADIQALLSVHSGAPQEALDSIALELAHLYATRKVDFAAADALANVMFAFATQHACLGSTLHAVFLAFDAGEYMPPNARKGVNPETEYTRPQIAKIIAGGGRSNNSLERTREG